MGKTVENVLIFLCFLRAATALSNRTDKQLDLSVEKECSDFGASAGRLEWRAWRDVDAMVARCYLHDAADRTSHAILWTYGHDAQVKKVLHICEFDWEHPEQDAEIFCEYKMKMSPESERLLCWVKTLNEWKSESRTACVSDEIYLKAIAPSVREEGKFVSLNLTSTTVAPPGRGGSSAEIPEFAVVPALRGEERRKIPPRKYSVEGLRWGQRYITDSEAESDTENFNKKYLWLPNQPWKPFNHYVVTVGPDVITRCYITDVDQVTHPVLWVFSGLARTDLWPQAMTWNASLSYASRVSGFFTIYLRRGGMKRDRFVKYGLLLKKCNMTQEQYRVPIVCSLTLPITDHDLGVYAFFANFKYYPEIKNGIYPQYCGINNFVKYSIAHDPRWARRQKIEKVPVVYNKRGRPRGINRTGLPWSTKPMAGPGVRLNGVQYVTVGASSAAAAMTLSCFWFAAAGMLRSRRARINALPCRCVDSKAAKKKKKIIG